MELSENQKIFLNYFLISSNLDQILNVLEKIMTLLAYVFLEVQTPKYLVS